MDIDYNNKIVKSRALYVYFRLKRSDQLRTKPAKRNNWVYSAVHRSPQSGQEGQRTANQIMGKQ